MEPEFLELLSQMADADLTKEQPENAVQAANHLEQYIADDSQCEQIFMPSYLTEQMINRVQQPDLQVELSARKLPKQLELFLYGCKVTAAVAASLLIMITATTMQNRLSSMERKTDFSVSSKAAEFDVPAKIMEQLDKGSLGITSWFQSISANITGSEKDN